VLQRGDSVPHFDLRTLDGEELSYSTIWQRRNLVLITLPASDSEPARTYASELTSRGPEFRGYGADCVITRDHIPGIQSPGALIADRWGEIAYVAATKDVAELPPVQELLEWASYVQLQCPECQGEAN
jgi:peroxiredoxin